jgi:cation:H+ antiporter
VAAAFNELARTIRPRARGPGLLFFAAYAVYFWREIRGGGGEHGDGEDLEPLLLQRRRAKPATWAVVTQTLATLVVIFAASQL